MLSFIQQDGVISDRTTSFCKQNINIQKQFGRLGEEWGRPNIVFAQLLWVFPLGATVNASGRYSASSI